MPNRLRSAAGVIIAGVGVACASGPPPADPGAAAALNEWRFGVAEHVALWYHGLALAQVGVESAAPVPIYRERYAAEVDAARRRLGSAATPLATDATTLARRLDAAGVAHRLQFLPLYFDSWQQLLQSVDVWRQASGDPNRAQGEAAAVIAFLSNLFPGGAQRAAVVEWVAALERERAAFFTEWWRDTQPSALASESQALWRQLQPGLIHFLRYNDAGSGRVSLTPALGGEGRMDTGRGIAVAALGGREGEDARVVVGRLIHELSYPLAAEATHDAVAPARIREIGEDVLVAQAAVRAGAMIIERLAPDLLQPYREYYLRAADADPARTTLTERFPLPDELLAALEGAVNLATAGI